MFLIIWLIFFLFLQTKPNKVFPLCLPQSIAKLPPFGPIEGNKWFDQISSQWEVQKKFAETETGTAEKSSWVRIQKAPDLLFDV
jgi:hypothetical protein